MFTIKHPQSRTHMWQGRYKCVFAPSHPTLKYTISTCTDCPRAMNVGGKAVALCVCASRLKLGDACQGESGSERWRSACNAVTESCASPLPNYSYALGDISIGPSNLVFTGWKPIVASSCDARILCAFYAVFNRSAAKLSVAAHTNVCDQGGRHN